MNKFTFSPKGLDLLKLTIVVLTIFIFIFVFGFTYSLTQYNIMVFFAGVLTLIGAIWFVAKQSSTTPLFVPYERHGAGDRTSDGGSASPYHMARKS